MPKTRDLTVGNLLPSALGGIAAGLVLSYFGVAGSLVGAALGPVVFLVVKEVTRGPTEAAVARAARTPGRADSVAHDVGSTALTTTMRVYRGRGRRRAGWLIATAVLASVIAIGIVTIPELITGGSLTGSGRTTFFHPGSDGSGAGGGGDTTTSTDEEPSPGTTTAPDEEAPASTQTTETTETIGTTTEPAPEATAPEAPATDPAQQTVPSSTPEATDPTGG